MEALRTATVVAWKYYVTACLVMGILLMPQSVVGESVNHESAGAAALKKAPAPVDFRKPVLMAQFGMGASGGGVGIGGSGGTGASGGSRDGGVGATIEGPLGGVSIGRGGVKVGPQRSYGDTGQERTERPASTGTFADVQTTIETDRARSRLVHAELGIDSELVKSVKDNAAKAVQAYTTALNNAIKSKKPGEKRSAAVNMGHVYYLSGQFTKAEAQYSAALVEARESKDLVSEAMLLNCLGAVAAATGAFDTGLRLYEQAIVKYKAADNEDGTARTLNNLAVLSRLRGRYDEAATQLRQALETGDKADDVRIHRLINLGRINSSSGNHKQAGECFLEALELAKKKNDPIGLSELYLTLGETYRTSGANAAALKSFRQALELSEKAPNKPPQLDYLIGSVLLDMGEIADAEAYINKSKFVEGQARLALMKGSHKVAVAKYGELVKQSEKNNLPGPLFAAYTGLGKSHEGLGELKRAEDYYAKAGDTAEEIRSGLLPSERGNFFAIPIYGFIPSEAAKGLVRVRFKMNKGQDTVTAGEQVRAREFADKIAQRADLTHLGLPGELAVREEDFLNKISSLKKTRAMSSRAQNPTRFDEITKEIRESEKEFVKFSVEIREKYPTYAAVRFAVPVDLKASALKTDENLIVYDILGEGVGIKLIQGKKVVFSAYEPYKADELANDVNRYLGCFHHVQLDKFDAELGTRLYGKLLAPVLQKIPEGTSITIQPDGILAALPFEGLVMSGTAVWKELSGFQTPTGLKYVGDAYSIAYSQSITAMTVARNSSRKKEQGAACLVMSDPVFGEDDARVNSGGAADDKPKQASGLLMAIMEETGVTFPRLPLTGTLGEALRQQDPANTELFQGLQASKSVLLDKPLSKYGSIICATHGYFGDDLPGIMEPVLVFSLVAPEKDGFLRMSEVMGLNLNAKIAALTACQTGLGWNRPGEGVMSMGWAFQYAGAESVLMSLWSVSESSSVKLVERTFRHMKDGKKRLEALQLARREIRDEGYEHPFFWSAFILVGEVD